MSLSSSGDTREPNGLAETAASARLTGLRQRGSIIGVRACINSHLHYRSRPENDRFGTDLRLGANFDRESSAVRCERTLSDAVGAHSDVARHAMKYAEELPVQVVSCRGKVRHGRADQAFELGKPGMVDGATANSLLPTTAGLDRMTRRSRQSSPQEAACGFWVRAWGQREPALQGTGRSHDHLQRRSVRAVDEPRAQLSEWRIPVFEVTEFRIPPEQVGTSRASKKAMWTSRYRVGSCQPIWNGDDEQGMVRRARAK